MEKTPYILEDEYPIGEKGKVKVILEFYLKEEYQDLEVDDEEILERLKDLYGDILIGICSNVAGSIYVLSVDLELAKRLIDVVTMDPREEVPIVTSNVPFVKDKEQERDFLRAYM